MVPWLGHMFLAKRTPCLLLAGLDALLGKEIRRLHRDEPRTAVGQRILGGLEHGGARATAADPAFGDGAVRQDHGLGAGLRGGRGHRAHHGCQRERLAGRLARRDDVENVGAAAPPIKSSPDKARAPPGFRDCAPARTDRHRAKPPACRAPAENNRASRSAD